LVASTGPTSTYGIRMPFAIFSFTNTFVLASFKKSIVKPSSHTTHAGL
jgi:hypothetical protein